jgi:hypothetical protein
MRATPSPSPFSKSWKLLASIVAAAAAGLQSAGA